MSSLMLAQHDMPSQSRSNDVSCLTATMKTRFAAAGQKLRNSLPANL